MPKNDRSPSEFDIPSVSEVISRRYRVVQCIVKRDHGSLYLVDDLQDQGNRKVLKTISPQALENTADRLVKEFKTVRSIGHPGVVRCYEFDFDTKHGAFFVMEFIDWPTLDSIRSKLNQQEIIRILYELSSTVHFIHLHGILHLDLKPDNIFIDYDSLLEGKGSDELTVKIADFGFARDISSRNTGDLYGSYIYTAPERFGSGKPDVRTDVFSIGMIGYVLLTNQIPYSKNSSLPLITQKKRYYPHLENWHDSIPRSLAMLLTRSLHPSPSYRPASARDFAIEIAPLVNRQISAINYIPNPPFVGRTPEMKQLSSLLHEVCEGEHWAYLLTGDVGSGKSRLIKEFIVQMQLRGYQCLKLEENNTSSLIAGIEESIRKSPEEETQSILPEMKLEEIFCKVITLAKSKPLIIAWFKFDYAGSVLQKAFLKFFLESRDVPILWLIEASREPNILASMGYGDKFVRRKLNELTIEASIEMFSEMLGNAQGSSELAVTLCNKVGRKPGWLLLALKEVIRVGKIEFKDAQWMIQDTKLNDWREILSKTWAYKPEGLTSDALAFAEWLAVLDMPVKLGELSDLVEISPSELGSVVSELENRDISIVEESRIKIRHPIVQERIYRSINKEKRKQIHKGAGRWLEDQLGDVPSIPDILRIAGHYFKAEIKSDFLRVMQQLFKRSDNISGIDIDPSLVRDALESHGIEWQPDIRLKGYNLLIQLLTDRNSYQEAVELCQMMIDDKDLKQVIDIPVSQLKLGHTLLLAGNYLEAKRYLLQSCRQFEGSNPDLALEAYYNLGFCALRSGNTDEANSYAEQCESLFEQNPSLQSNPQALLRGARLCSRVGNYDIAGDFFEMIVNRNSGIEQNATDFHAHTGLINIDLNKGRIKSVTKRLDTLEKSLPVKLLQQFRWKIVYYRMIVFLMGGEIQAACNLLDNQWTSIRLTASTRNQCHMLLNIIIAGYYSGAYTRSIRYLRRAFMIAIRSSHAEIVSILYVWALRLRSMAGKNSHKLEKIALEYFHECQGSMGKATSGFLLTEYYLTIDAFEKADHVLSESYDAFRDHGTGIPEIAIKSMKSLIDIKLNYSSKASETITITGDQGDTVEDFFSRGMSYYWQLLTAMHTNLPQAAEKCYQSAQKYFKMIGALYWIAKTQEKYGRYLSQSIDPVRGGQITSEAENLLRNLALPTFKGTDLGTVEEPGESTNSETRPLPIKELAEVLELLNTSGKPEDLTHRLLEIAIKGMQASRGLIYFKRDNTGGLPRRAAIRIGRDEEIRISRSIIEEVFNIGKPIFSDDATRDVYLRSLESVQLDKLRTIACFPIVSSGNIEGVIYLDFGPDARQLDKSHKHYLSMIAQLIGTILTHERVIHKLRSDVKTLRRTIDGQDGYDQIRGKSRAMQEVFRQLLMVKGYDIPVLILGESGTGKELVARTVHRDSLRAENQFVTVNCAAFPEHLIESLLFGHVKGAFTGANSNHVGLFEQANGGTIFLDEVEETSWAMQGKLLRVLQDGEYYRLGESRPRICNVRLITAGKPSLLHRVEAGTFRSDLFYRMKVAQINVPTLADRREDIPLLVEHFLGIYSAKYGKSIKSIDNKALFALEHFQWPGNIRQLEHCIQQIVLSAGDSDVIKYEHLPAEITPAQTTPVRQYGSLSKAVGKFEADLILNTLVSCNWNKNDASKKLKLSLSSLRRKIIEYDLEDKRNK